MPEQVVLIGKSLCVTVLVKVDSQGWFASIGTMQKAHVIQIKPSSRFASFDIFRGLLLVVIMIDHLQRFPGLYEYVTGKGYLWSSVAEAFFILSGLMAGLVYVRRNQTQSFTVTTRKLWRRAGTLYLWSVGLTLLYTGLAYALGLPPGLKLGLASNWSVWELLRATVSLKYVYGWADFLAYYAIFLAVAPVAAWFLRRGQWWIVAAASLGIWMCSGSNFVLSWQILFYFGMAAGYYIPEIQAAIRRLSPRQRVLGGTAIVGLAVLTWTWSSVIITLRSVMEHRAISNIGSLSLINIDRVDNVLARHFDKTTLPTLRLIVSGLWFTGLLVLLRQQSGRVWRFMKHILVPLGRHSLLTYILHSFVLFWLDIVVPHTVNRLENIVLTTGMLVGIWLTIYIIDQRQSFMWGATRELGSPLTQ